MKNKKFTNEATSCELYFVPERTYQSPFVKKIEPFPYIGEGGGTVTIFGGGFSENVFNFGKPNHGNKVTYIDNRIDQILAYRSGLRMIIFPYLARLQSSGTSYLKIHKTHQRTK